MKRNFIVLIGAIVMLFAASSCEKTVEQSDVYEVQVTMTLLNESLASGEFDGLSNTFSDTDAILVYVSTGDESWMPLPTVDGDEEYTYELYNDGVLVFYDEIIYGNLVFTGTFENSYRIIRIPHYAFTEKKAEGVDHNNYNEVMRAYNLYECNVIMKK